MDETPYTCPHCHGTVVVRGASWSVNYERRHLWGNAFYERRFALSCGCCVWEHDMWSPAAAVQRAPSFAEVL